MSPVDPTLIYKGRDILMVLAGGTLDFSRIKKLVGVYHATNFRDSLAWLVTHGFVSEREGIYGLTKEGEWWAARLAS